MANNTPNPISQLVENIRAQIVALKQQLTARRAAENDYEMSTVISCLPNSVSRGTITVPSNGDFLMEGYNIAYTIGAGGLPTLSKKMRDVNSVIPVSSYFVPLELVAPLGA